MTRTLLLAHREMAAQAFERALALAPKAGA
ncbi:hypothetical protein HRbin23_00154 [bacterium HR23]|nr:hypothetical protein HRbin23_00154 [bacterium HR23]